MKWDKAYHLVHKLAVYLFCIYRIWIRKTGGWKKKKFSREVLVINVHHLGDSALFLDCLRALCKYYAEERGYRVRVAGNRENLAYYKAFGNCRVEEYIALDERYGIKEYRFGIGGFRQAYQYLNTLKAEVVAVPFYNIYGILLSACVESNNQYIVQDPEDRLSGSRIYRYICGRAGNHVIMRGKWNEMWLTSYRNLLREMGIRDYRSKIGRIEAGAIGDPGVRDACRELGEFCVIVPGAKEDARRWEVYKFAEVIRMINKEMGLGVVLAGAKGEAGIGEELERACKGEGRLVNLTGKTGFNDLAAVIAGSRFVFGNDTGTIHIAAALGIPSLYVMSHKDVGKCQPYELDETVCSDRIPEGIWSREKPLCAGCRINSEAGGRNNIKWPDERCRRSVCAGGPFYCLSAIEAEQVKRKLRRKWEEWQKERKE